MKEVKLEDERLCGCRRSREKSLTIALPLGDALGLRHGLQRGVAPSL